MTKKNPYIFGRLPCCEFEVSLVQAECVKLARNIDFSSDRQITISKNQKKLSLIVSRLYMLSGIQRARMDKRLC